ncbi:MAG TPA: hypothetical protein VJ327_11370 [Patescibacteria group bacterium]|nr:hypothetical protein [Patescibacteria group bacterium]
MAGSLKWFVYTTDDGGVYGLFGDESNIEAINSGGDYTGTPALTEAVPRNITPRRAVYGSVDGSRTITIPVLTSARLLELSTDVPTIADPLSSATLVLLRVRPEVRRLPIPNDTGLDDGDLT